MEKIYFIRCIEVALVWGLLFELLKEKSLLKHPHPRHH